MNEAKRIGETIANADVVVLTCGIVAKSTREVSDGGHRNGHGSIVP
jgi:hypothetical protein